MANKSFLKLVVLLIAILAIAIGILYWQQISKTKNGPANQVIPDGQQKSEQKTEQKSEQKQETAILADKVSGKVESINEKNNSFVVKEGIVSSGQELFNVILGDKTLFVKLIYPRDYDPQKPPASGVEVKSESATFKDLKVGDVVYVHVGQPFNGNKISAPTLIEIQVQ